VENLHCIKWIRAFRDTPTADNYLNLYHEHLAEDSTAPANVPSSMITTATKAKIALEAAITFISMNEGVNGYNHRDKSTAATKACENKRRRSSGDATKASEEARKVYDLINHSDLIEEIIKTNVMPVLSAVEKELTGILERDILPRFKATKEFTEYIESEPVLFRVASRQKLNTVPTTGGQVIKVHPHGDGKIHAAT